MNLSLEASLALGAIILGILIYLKNKNNKSIDSKPSELIELAIKIKQQEKKVGIYAEQFDKDLDDYNRLNAEYRKGNGDN